MPPCDPCTTLRRFTARVEGGVSLLSDLDERIGVGVPAGTQELSWDGVDYCPAFAARIGFEARLSPCSSIEVGGAWYGSFESDGRRSTGAFGFSPPPGAVSPEMAVSLDAEAEVYGARAVWWQTFEDEPGHTADFGLGARWIRFEESGSATDWQPVTGATPALYGEATNDLVAALFAMRIAFQVCPGWTVGVSGEVFAGWMRRDLEVRDDAVFSAGTHASSLEEDDFSWGFELEASVTRSLSEHVAVRASVGVLYLGEVNRVDTLFDFGRADTGVVQARDDGREVWIPLVFLGFEVSF